MYFELFELKKTRNSINKKRFELLKLSEKKERSLKGKERNKTKRKGKQNELKCTETHIIRQVLDVMSVQW